MRQREGRCGKMRERREKISWREVYSLNKRALNLWRRERPMLFVSSGLYSVIAALIPYLTLYCSSRLLDELAGARRPEKMGRWVIILLVSEVVVCLVKALVFRWKEALSATIYYQGEERFSRKMLDMDFAVADDAATHSQLSQILQREQWTGWGLGRIYGHFGSLMEELFRMLGGAALTVSLFRRPVTRETGWLTLLNSPLCILVLALVMIGITALSPYLATLGGNVYAGP